MNRLLGLVLFAAFAVAGLFNLTVGQALAGHIECGDVITQDTTLDSDLLDCPREGIVIGADNVTLDLNGHVVDGTENFSSGILNQGHANVTIQHGTVQEFGLEVAVVAGEIGWPPQMSSPDQNTVRDIAASGIAVRGSDRNRVEDNVSDVIEFRSSNDNVIDGNIGSNRGGVFIQAGSRNLIQHNSGFIAAAGGAANIIRENRDLFVLDLAAQERTLIVNNFSESPAVWLIGHVRHTEIKHNVLSGGLFTAMVLHASSDNLLEANRILNPGEAGIVLSGGSNYNVIRRNTVNDAFDNRSDPRPRYGPFDGSGIAVLGSHNSRIENNAVLRNETDGIAVDRDSSGTVLLRNRAHRNGDDGIDVDGAASLLTGNAANWNGDLGIEAVLGVSDGGGNRAFGNGNPLQCVNVLCKPKGRSGK